MSKFKRNFMVLSTIAGFLITSYVVACNMTDVELPSDTIREFPFGARNIYIPQGYLKEGTSLAGGTGYLIGAFYPGSHPIPGDPIELWQEKLWWNKITILMQMRVPYRPSRKSLDSAIATSSADHYAGKKYGLDHYTQSDEEFWWKSDIYIEDADISNYIQCNKKQSEIGKARCTHWFYHDRNLFNLSYRFAFLPDWKQIKDNVIALHESFRTAESAAAYYNYITNIHIDWEKEDDDTIDQHHTAE